MTDEEYGFDYRKENRRVALIILLGLVIGLYAGMMGSTLVPFMAGILLVWIGLVWSIRRAERG